VGVVVVARGAAIKVSPLPGKSAGAPLVTAV